MEASSPMRTFTGTMRVAGGEFPVVPVRSATAVERDALLALAKTVAGALAKAPVSIGDVVLVTDESVVLVATASVAPDTGNR
jgi:CxxC motif-containing protein